MKNIDQKYHRQSIISDYCNQIIHRRDQRTGCNCRINMDLVEEHRDDRTYKTRDYHRNDQRNPNAPGNQEC